jgi:hypothetical protein
MIVPNHVAILVPSVRKAADYLSRFNFQIGKEETFEGEGTKEIYVEKGKANALLLMEAIGPGPYQQAMGKRGPGIHHLAIDVPNLESYLESLDGAGWLLHPRSIKMIKVARTAYLARPGFPALIEVQESSIGKKDERFVNEVGVDLNSDSVRLLNAVGLESIVKPSDEVNFLFDKTTVLLKDLL